MLNRCPSCQASVLDDDAEVCPFCGSPMDPAKAKGFAPAASSAPPAKAAAKPATPVAKAPSEPRKPAPSKPSPLPADEDPFAVDRRSASGAVALSPKRTQQRPHKVICPMCDTAGYAAESASGKEVRCANPKCLVPVFKAPDFAAPKPAEPEPPASALNPTVLTFGAVGVILLGVAVWWFVLREAPLELPPLPETAKTPTAVGPSGDPVAPEGEPAVSAPPPPSPEEVLSAALARWPEVANDIVQPQRQALRRRYAAESFAMAGRPEAAREQLDRIAGMKSADVYYQIPPLSELAWASLSSGEEAAAKAAFEQARSLATQIPQQGFDPARVVIDWSAAAARWGQAAAARDLARTPRDDAAGEQLLALLESASLFNAGDLDAEHGLRPVRLWADAKSAGVTFELLARNASEPAKEWASGSSEVTPRAENFAAWAEAAAVASAPPPDGLLNQINALVASNDPAERAYVNARTAVRLAGRENGKAAAEKLLTAVTESAGGFPSPELIDVSSLAALHRADLAVGSGGTLRGLAFAEAAHAASRLGKADQASAFLAQALDHLRAAAPSPAAAEERRQEFDRLGITGVQAELKSSLGLANDDQARQAANAYRRKVQDLQSAAAARFGLQAELLSRAVDWSLGAKVIEEAQRRHAAPDAVSREPYLAGSAGGRLLAAFQAVGDTAAVQTVREAGVRDGDVPQAGAMEAAVAKAATEKPEAAARELDAQRWSRVGRSESLSVAIRMACRTARDRSTSDAFAFAAAVRNEATREEVLRYLSLYVARAGSGGEARQLLQKLRLGPTEEAAVLRGLSEGAVAAGGATALTSDAATAEAPETP